MEDSKLNDEKKDIISQSSLMKEWEGKAAFLSPSFHGRYDFSLQPPRVFFQRLHLSEAQHTVH